MRIFARVIGLSVIMLMLSFSAVFAEAQVFKAPMNPEFERYMESLGDVQPQSVGEDDEHGLGYVPSPVLVAPRQRQTATKADMLPSRFDLREEGGVTSVKDQGRRGSCWTFGSLGSIESKLKYNKGMEFDFSEMNMANNNGFDSIDGGDAFKSMAYLSRGDGPVDEKEDPYEYARYNSPSSIDRIILIKDMIMLPSDMESAKKGIMEHGALESGMCWENEFYNEDTSAYFCNDEYAYANHEIVVVGWDDDYSALNFEDEPEGDGAWICKNSWGEEFGEGGFFYISYYDSVFIKPSTYYDGKVGSSYGTELITYEIDEDNSYDSIYQHDDLGCTWSCGYNRDEAFFANVFECDNPLQSIDAVGFYTLGYDSEYEVYVVRDYECESDLGDGMELVASGTIKNGGYHTIELDESFSVSNGQRFAAAVKISTPGQYYPIAVEHALEYYSSAARAYEGESFISENGIEWQDSSKNDGFNVCIKAYASDAQPVDDESAKDFAAGLELHNDGNYEGAVEFFESAIDKNPHVGEYYLYKGICHGRLLEFEKAIDAFDEGLSLSDESYEVLSSAKGAVLQSRGDYERAIESYEGALEIRESENVLFGKAQCLSALGMYEDALPVYEKLIVWNRYNYDYLIELARCYFETGDYEACIYTSGEAVELNGKSMKALMFQVRSCLELEEYEWLVKYAEDMQEIYDSHWSEKGDEEAEYMMCEAMAMKARAFVETSRSCMALKALEESQAHGSSQRADEIRADIERDLYSYEQIELDSRTVESDHVFTIEFTGKVDSGSIDGNIIVVDEDGRIVETESYIYGIWESVRVSPVEEYKSADHVLYIGPSISSMDGESLSSGARISFTVSK